MAEAYAHRTAGAYRLREPSHYSLLFLPSRTRTQFRTANSGSHNDV